MALDEKRIDLLLSLAKRKIMAKSKLYDGYNSTLEDNAVNKHFFSCVEEIGEISSAYIRNRIELAKQECIDVIHSAMNLYFAIENEQVKQENK